ncbi:MAG: hypothetical protein KF862_16600 [Chitinophagaceae bacterium]|nr:hypothetical protein [Chitinophagaceae bacterium]
MLTVTDKREPVPVSGNPSVIASYKADVMTAADYSPFGMTLPGRAYNNHWQKYRYGFNGKESDSEVNGPYNELDYGFRIYEPRLGRFLSVDPLTRDFPSLTPYQYASNSPIENSDLDGLESLSQIKANLEKQWRAQIEVKNSLELRTPRLIMSWLTGGNQYSQYQIGATPQYSQEEKQRRDAEWRSYLRNSGYNEDASKPLWMKIADDKTFNKFADNIALPVLEIMSFVDGVGEARAAFKAIGKIGIPRSVSKVGFIRNNFGIKETKNIAILEGQIGNTKINDFAISGQKTISGFIDNPTNRVFSTHEVGGYDRLFDSEVKLLENIAQQYRLTPNIEGSIKLISERTFCSSCEGVIKQFNKKFPNIKVEEVSGVK